MRMVRRWILAQTLNTPLPRIPRGGVVAVAALPLFGVVAAFGTAPATLTGAIPTEPVIQALPSPETERVASGRPHFWREETARRGDTLANVLMRLNVSDPAVHSYLRQSKEAKPLLQLAPGRTVHALTEESGSFLALRYRTGPGKELLVTRIGDAYATKTQPAALETQIVMKSATVRGSLFSAMDNADVPDAISEQLLKIFSGDIDFHKDTRRGDRFSVVYEAHHVNGALLRTGRLLAAEFASRGKRYQAVWFEGEPGKGAYYTPEGKTVRKSFLRSPIEFSRISSGFTEMRLHPILQHVRAHKGIDYAAPVGTRVLASADGTVDFVGQQSGYGNAIIIEHRDGVSTLYAHLSGFAPGVMKGQRVEQGEVIGYVGMTGLTTGPHLHYEFRVNGEHQDPVEATAAFGIPLSSQLLSAFEQEAAPLARRLELLRGTELARFE